MRHFLIVFAGFVALAFGGAAAPVLAQTRILPLGDSITQGGQLHASYRYELWFDLLDAGAVVDFVGTQNSTFGGDPNLSWYPDYFTTFDRDHSGTWGIRTNAVAAAIAAIAGATDPDIALVHLGTNDIGQSGAAGVLEADFNLRFIIGALRAQNPNVAILLAQVIPIGPGTSYFANADQVVPLNSVIADIAADSTRTQSPVVLVDQYSGYDLGTLMQSDGLHPNLAGEERIADTWMTALLPFLSGVNPPPAVQLTSPSDGFTGVFPEPLTMTASASDPNGSVAEVRSFADGVLVGTDAAPPYTILWSPSAAGFVTLTAEAEDDEGATRTSAPVTVGILPFAGGTSIPVANGSFEAPALGDGQLADGPGVFGGWNLYGSATTYTGIFNPPTGSYPDAAGNAAPLGADGANVCYLFHNGTGADSVSATQVLGEVLLPNTEYLLQVAIGRFLPDQPYAFSTFGGYRIDLSAGGQVIASSVDEVLPPFGAFRDAFTFVSSASVPASLLGQPLAVHLDLATAQAPRSTHFDFVRLSRRALATSAGAEGSERLVAAEFPWRVVPQPFREAAHLEFELLAPCKASIDLVDVRGRVLHRLTTERTFAPGFHRLEILPVSVSGVYFVRWNGAEETRLLRIVSLGK